MKRNFHNIKCVHCLKSINKTINIQKQEYSTLYNTNEQLFTLNKFFCPNCNKEITLQEDNQSNKKIYWKTNDEYCLQRFLGIEQFFFQKNTTNYLVNLYYPNYNDEDFIISNFDKIYKNYKGNIMIILPTFMKDKYYEYCKNKAQRLYVVPNSMFDMAIGTLQPSLLASLNLYNESMKFENSQCLSIYNSGMNEIKNINENKIDYDLLKQKII